jgi:ribosome biogenesis protein ERB1
MTAKGKKNAAPKKEVPPDLSPASEEDDEDGENDSVYDSEVASYEGDSDDDDDDDDEDSEDGDGEEEFEDQGSSDEDGDLLEKQDRDDSSEGSLEILDEIQDYETAPRQWKRSAAGATKKTKEDKKEEAKKALWMHTDDLSSDDEDTEGVSNRIGKVPLHWYDEYDHIGYDGHGSKVMKSTTGGDRIDQAIQNADNKGKKFMVHDALNDKEVELTERQLELIRRVQAGAFAHPEFDANPDYIDYFSGVNKEVSGLSSNRIEPKSRFQPSQWERLQVQRLLDKFKDGKINMDYLTGKIRDMRDAKNKEDPNAPFMLWQGDEDDELAMRKGPQHLAAPKLPPPGHAESYIPPDEYLPTEEDMKEWEKLDPKDRPYGMLIPKKHQNLRSVGAYEYSVREAFERCLDLYLCPRIMKRRLNIDPESLVPKLPKASDLRPFPTAKCIEYKTPYEGEEVPIIRSVSPSPDGQYMASGASDGFVRLWEVQTGRLLQSWNVSKLVSAFDSESEDGATMPVVVVEWNPNKQHHCLVAAVGKCIVLIATGTGDATSSEITEALLADARAGGNVTNAKALKVVDWKVLDSNENPVSSFASQSGPVAALVTTKEIASVRWHRKGDYFVTVAPKAGASAVLIHQLSKGNSQQPFSKSKGEAQLACFHPTKPFLFVASTQHIRVYHLVKQTMVKRLLSGCRHISSIDIHSSGDHLIVGSLDRKMIWFDLDLSHTPYKTLKYHERALRGVHFSNRYPLMASCSDDGVVHVFHAMVYTDLMRNPMLIPVKILKGHVVTNKLGVLTTKFHPTQPWLFTGGADGRIFLYQDI